MLNYPSHVFCTLGALSVSVEDADRGTASEQPIFDEPGERGWSRCTLPSTFDAQQACLPPQSIHDHMYKRSGQVKMDDDTRTAQVNDSSYGTLSLSCVVNKNMVCCCCCRLVAPGEQRIARARALISRTLGPLTQPSRTL
jgi:hypothetical protein